MKFPFLFFLLVLFGIGFISGLDDYFCFTKLKNNEIIPSAVNSIGDKLTCVNGFCTCRLETGEGYCLVCSNSSGWLAAYSECNSDYCDPNEIINGPLDQFVKFPFKDNATITKQRFFVEINTTRKSKIDFINMMNGEKKNFCMHCNYFRKMFFFDEGFNDYIIKSAVAGEVREERIRFFIDTKKPRILKTSPSPGSFASGEFIIDYEENFIKKVELFYGEKNDIQVKELICENGKKQCRIKLNLDEYNGKTIYYWFSIEDVAGSIVNSSKLRVNVDNEGPIINGLYVENGNVILNVSEDNFYRAIYFENGKEKLFCGTLNKGVCSRKMSINELKLRVIDKAGNFVEKEINTNI